MGSIKTFSYIRIFGWDLLLFSVFGVMGLLNLMSRISAGNWEIATRGHWRDGPYLVFGVILFPYVTLSVLGFFAWSHSSIGKPIFHLLEIPAISSK